MSRGDTIVAAASGAKVTRRITADRFLDLTPTWSPDGRYLLFSSDRDQVFNVYAHDLETGALAQVTNVIGGAYQARPSPDGCWPTSPRRAVARLNSSPA